MISLARMAGIVAAGLTIWVAVDLYRPVHQDLRYFDPVAVGKSETTMWRAYYDHDRLKLFGELTALLRTQYGMPFWRSTASAFHAAKAAVVFQRGDYQGALPDLKAYYESILRSSTSHFRPDSAAKLELEWWIVHRERDRHGAGDLQKSLADLQAEIYELPAARFAEHGRDRAEAMRLRDAGEDWSRIEGLLVASWSSLHREVTR